MAASIFLGGGSEEIEGKVEMLVLFYNLEF